MIVCTDVSSTTATEAVVITYMVIYIGVISYPSPLSIIDLKTTINMGVIDCRCLSPNGLRTMYGPLTINTRILNSR